MFHIIIQSVRNHTDCKLKNALKNTLTVLRTTSYVFMYIHLYVCMLDSYKHTKIHTKNVCTYMIVCMYMRTHTYICTYIIFPHIMP